MKRISMAVLAALAFALVACGEEKAPEVAKAEPAPEPAEPAVEAAKPVEPAKAVEPAPAPTPDAPAAAAAGGQAVPDVAQRAIEGAKKGAVTFPHKMHVGLPIMGGKCNVCHHTSDDKGTGAQKCTAAGCHDGSGKVGPKDAFHDLCRGCHTKALAEQPDNAKLKNLKSCKGCHVG